MKSDTTKINYGRIGFHYYPDMDHYKNSDLNQWLPELKALGANWLSVKASLDRAIPEAFVTGLVNEGIYPILYFNLQIDSKIDINSLELLLQSYKKWGIKHISLFDKPNMHGQWGSSSWTQKGLVDRFLDIFLPLANLIYSNGLTPIFPPLEPSGDYWDTAFLRAALTGIKSRGNTQLLNNMVLGAYAWAGNQPFGWGAGGPERWVGARPYFTPHGEENHLGFRIFDWYNAISEAVLNKKLPILLVACGSNIGDEQNEQLPAVDEISHNFRNLQLARFLSNEHEAMRDGATFEPIPDNILAACFWVLATSEDHPEQKNAWYRSNGTTLPVVQSFQSRVASQGSNPGLRKQDKTINTKPPKQKCVENISHYLLLPNLGEKTTDWNINTLLPFINKYHPTVGYSYKEASQASRVTMIGDEQSFSKDFEDQLRNKGCQVHRIIGNGTSIATQLETI